MERTMRKGSEAIEVIKWVALWTVLAVVLAPVIAYLLFVFVLWSLDF